MDYTLCYEENIFLMKGCKNMKKQVDEKYEKVIYEALSDIEKYEIGSKEYTEAAKAIASLYDCKRSLDVKDKNSMNDTMKVMNESDTNKKKLKTDTMIALAKIAVGIATIACTYHIETKGTFHFDEMKKIFMRQLDK